MSKILLPAAMDARPNVAFGERSTRFLAGQHRPKPARNFVTVSGDPNMLMKNHTVIAKPWRLTPRGRISGVVNTQLTDCLPVGSVHQKRY